MCYFCCVVFNRYSTLSTFEQVIVDVLQRQMIFISFFVNNRLLCSKRIYLTYVLDFPPMCCTRFVFQQIFSDYWVRVHFRIASFRNRLDQHFDDCNHCNSNDAILFVAVHPNSFFHCSNFGNSKHVLVLEQHVCQVCNLNYFYDVTNKHYYSQEHLVHRSQVNVHLTHFCWSTSSKVIVVFKILELSE